MGTTGAAMLLIRPLLKANDNRKHRVHVVVFFIFLVANIGGGLTPLGDPPAVSGLLERRGFYVDGAAYAAAVFISSVILLTAFYFLDRYFFSKEDEILPVDPAADSKLQIFGKWNFLLLGGVVSAVLMSGIWKPGISFEIFGSHYALQNLVRDGILLALALISLKITPTQVRARVMNSTGIRFSKWGKLFLGIFITISPVIAILKAGEAGHFRELISLVHTPDGAPINSMYFWMSRPAFRLFG